MSQGAHIFLIRLKTPIFLCNTKLPFNSSAGVGEGWSAAHKNFRLLLLPSGPDKVHGISLRRTQTIPGEAIKGQYLICHTYYYIVFARLCQEMFHENYFRLLQKWYCLKLVKKKLFWVTSGYNSYNNLTLFWYIRASLRNRTAVRRIHQGVYQDSVTFRTNFSISKAVPSP